MPVKSAQNIRRTMVSLLHKKGVALDDIRRYLEHTDEMMTIGYFYNQNTEEKSKKMIY
jgi:hypothetical protein